VSAVITSWVGAQLGALIAGHLLIAVAVVLFIEELGIPLPVPGDLIMLLAGIEVSRGTQPLWAVLLVEEIATLCGASVLFVVSRRVGRALVARFGRYIGFGPDRLAQVEERVRHRAAAAVLVGRLIPGLRIVTVIAAGVVDVPPARFLPSLAIGAFIYLFGYTMLGFVAGPPVLNVFERLAVPVTGLLALAALVGVVFVMRAFRRSERMGPFARESIAALVAGGVLAAVAAVLTSSVWVGIAGIVNRVTGGAAALTPERVSGELQVLFGWPLFFTIALVIVGAFAWLRLDRLPLALRLVVSAGIPLLTTVLLIDPLTDTARVGLPESNALALTTVAIIRWTVFALAFELLPIRSSPFPAQAPAAPDG
jgi:membrane protein DedA with SNARE-associated domain